MKLSGRTAIVTGAASGIGKAIAELYAREGAKVIVSDINEEAINQVVEGIKEEGGQAAGIVADVSKDEEIDAMVKLAVDEFGSLDILVNNAGILDNFMTVGEVSDQVCNQVIAVNLTGPFKISRAAIKIMEGQENGGVIINNASIGGLFGSRGGAAYVSSKHGLIGLTKNIAATYGIHGKIRANVIAPGAVRTNISSSITAEASKMGQKALAGAGAAPLGESEQLAQAALFLASDDSSFVNGDVMVVDGGWTSV